MSDLLSLLWGDFSAPGHYLSLNTRRPGKQPNGDEWPVVTKWYPMEARDSVVRKHPPEHFTDHNIFFGVCARHENLGSGRRGGEADTNAMPALWVDFDYEAGKAHANKNLPTQQQCLEWMDRLIRPNAVVHSGHGYHCYWVFDEPWTFASGGGYRGPQQLLIAFQQRVRDLGNGFHLDATTHMHQMLRYPDTTNWKIDSSSPVVLVHEDDDFRSREELAEWAGTTITETVAVQVPDALVAQHVTLVPFDKDKVLEALEANKSRPALAKLLVSGKPFKEGERDHTAKRAAGLLATVARAQLKMSADVDDLFSVMEPTYLATCMAPEAEHTPPPPERKVRGMLAASIKSAHGKALIEEAKEAAAEAWIAKKRNGLGPLKTEELSERAVSFGVETDVLMKRLVIAHNGWYWTLNDKEYRRNPWPKDDLLAALHQDLDIVPGIQWKRPTSAGGEVPKTASDIVGQYGTVANAARMSLITQKTYYDAQEDTLVIAAAPLAPITPRFHANVDKWMRLLGGDQQELLLDWVASVTNHALPSSAIYMMGSKGAGKTMFAAGLARLWSSRRFATFENVIDYGSDIANAPLIFADEFTPKDMGKNVTGKLRKYVANSTHSIKEKYKPNMEIEGCLRVFLAANNEKMLDDGSEHSHEDIEAIAQRFIFIRFKDEPSKFLTSLGGRAGTRDWVDGDVIAAHALWLKEHREPKMGARFLNEGQRTEFHDNLVSQNAVSAQVIEALFRAGSEPTEGVILGEGLMLVNANSMFKEWDTLSVGAHALSSVKRIGNVLSTLAIDSEQVNLRTGKARSRYWNINWKTVVLHGERVGLDSQKIEARLKNTLTEEVRTQTISAKRP